MRVVYSNIDRAKKSAKRLATVSGAKLSDAQRLVAVLSGYRDWHDLEKSVVGNNQPTDCIKSSDRKHIIHAVRTISSTLDLSFGDSLYCLYKSVVLGLAINSTNGYEEIWVDLLREQGKYKINGRDPGAIVRIRAPGFESEMAILREYGRPTRLITHTSLDTWVTDFEVVFPRKFSELFVPARLKFLYGLWTESDGAQVLFSRDYKPLWRIRNERALERLDPWLWIDKVDEVHFWDDAQAPWRSSRRFKEECRRLDQFGVVALPKLADILPDVIENLEIKNVNDAVREMAKRAGVSLRDDGFPGGYWS